MLLNHFTEPVPGSDVTIQHKCHGAAKFAALSAVLRLENGAYLNFFLLIQVLSNYT